MTKTDPWPCHKGSTWSNKWKIREAMKDKSVFIMRGLPGMGKSSISQMFTSLINDTVVCSADNYFVNANGEYVFKANEIGDAHMSCKKAFIDAMVADTSLIIVDNTNVRRKDFQYYESEALRFGYKVFEITVGNLDVEASVLRNSHGVPMEAIKRMADALAGSWK